MMLRNILFLFIIFSTLSDFATNSTETDGIKGSFDLGLNYSQNVDKTLQFNNVFFFRKNCLR